MNFARKLRDWLLIGLATIGLCQFAWSQGQFLITTIAGTEIMTLQNAGPYPVGITTANFLAGGTTPVKSVYTSSSATPGTVRDIWGTAKVGAALTMTSGNLVGVRGEQDVPSGTTAGTSAFLYGAQGKLIGGGTYASGLNACGLCGQWDFSTGTYTAGTVSVLWLDAGASASSSAQSTSFGGDSHILRMTNTTNAGAALTSDIIYAYANSNYFMTLGAPANTINYFATAGTGGTSCGASGGAVAAKVLKISVGGVDYWIPLCSSNS